MYAGTLGSTFLGNTNTVYWLQEQLFANHNSKRARTTSSNLSLLSICLENFGKVDLVSQCDGQRGELIRQQRAGSRHSVNCSLDPRGALRTCMHATHNAIRCRHYCSEWLRQNRKSSRWCVPRPSLSRTMILRSRNANTSKRYRPPCTGAKAADSNAASASTILPCAARQWPFAQ